LVVVSNVAIHVFSFQLLALPLVFVISERAITKTKPKAITTAGFGFSSLHSLDVLLLENGVIAALRLL
jgi:hypothetical protein